MKILVPEELIPLIEKSIFDGSILDKLDGFMNSYSKREKFRKGTSWHIPTDEMIREIKKYSPILSVCSGYAYTESLLEKEGVDIVCTDIHPNKKNAWCMDGKFYTKVEELDAEEAVIKYNNRNVFMAWPPYNYDVAERVVKAMDKNKVLIYVGERSGGCTGNDNFFEYLNNNFEEIESDISIPKWEGLHDNIYFYKKLNKINF